jgi:hypothetical protein
VKITTYADGSELKVSETPEDEEQLMLEFPNPFLANRTRQIRAELLKLDPDLTVELVMVPRLDAATGKVQAPCVIYCRDMSLFPPRLVQTILKEEDMQYDSCAQLYAKRLFDYWTRKRSQRNAKQ